MTVYEKIHSKHKIRNLPIDGRRNTPKHTYITSGLLPPRPREHSFGPLRVQMLHSLPSGLRSPQTRTPPLRSHYQLQTYKKRVTILRKYHRSYPTHAKQKCCSPSGVRLLWRQFKLGVRGWVTLDEKIKPARAPRQPV